MRRFTDTTIFTDIGCIITSQLTSQRLHTLLRPISHVASSPRHWSHSPNLRFHIYHHSIVHFACLSAKDCGTPRTVTLRLLWSRRSRTRRTAFGFCVLLLCTALIRRLSAYQRTREIQLETIIFLILNASKYSLSPSALPCMICGT